jgi:glycosyltransferase involved in cell wall biosynthesis
MLITVALCTHNHADRIRRTLEDLGRLAPPTQPWEILVVDNGCTDETPGLLADHHWRPEGTPVRVVREDKLGLSNARNRALQESNGEYLLFIDDDETPDPQWLTAYEQAMLAHEPDALGGRIEVLFEHGLQPAWLQEELLGFLGRLDHGAERWLISPDTPFYGGNFAVRRAVFAEVGEFDTELGRKGRINLGGEDTEFYRRLVSSGHTVRWVPDAVIHHRIRADKLRRSYFLELHYRQGKSEGARKRGDGSRLPPVYLFGQLGRALWRAFRQRMARGRNHSLRLEMNAIYFLGYLQGWAAR